VSRPIVEASGLRKSFSIPSVRRTTVREHVLDAWRPRRVEELRVLDGIDFAVEPGEAFGIMGRNGSGKSTLLKIVAGIYPADSGRVAVRGSLTPILELGLGFNPELDAIDNVLLLGGVMGLGVREIRRLLDEILAFAELERFAAMQLKHFSSGMSARLAYAVAFSAVREILILDEIFAVGDAGFKQRCTTRCRELHAEGRTVILVSHDPETLSSFCSRALLLDGGRVVSAGASGEVAAEYVRRVT
jgi:ABC-type polysaccharide/polyol phosphate transport system ATPase subunit